MQSYVILFHFNDKNTLEQFGNEFEKTYPVHQTADLDNLTYYGFADRELPRVQDTIETITHRFGISDNDYIALYHTREERPDDIDRIMLLGPDRLIENHLEEEKIGREEHIDRISNLLNTDYIKLLGQQKAGK